MKKGIYIQIFDAIKKHEKAARAAHLSSYGADGDTDDDMIFTNARFEIEEVEFTGDHLVVNGDIYEGKDKIMYIGFNLPIKTELVQEIIASYVKKLNKMRTVLEGISQ